MFVILIGTIFPLLSIPKVSGDLSNSSKLSPHNRIHIKGNDQFNSTNGVVAGDGTKNNPYIIENWSIDATTDYGIRIENTNASFIIRNCYIYNGSNQSTGDHGIYFRYVENGVIVDNRIIFNDVGIYFHNSDKIKILNNSFMKNNESIILSFECDRNIISNNTFTNNRWSIYIWRNSNNNTFSNNICVSNKKGGIDMIGCNNNIIKNNKCNSNNGMGISIDTSNSNLIFNNTFNSNKNDGIYCYESNHNEISNNVCNSNKHDGIFIRGHSNYNIIKNNFCTLNNKTGIYIWDSCNNNKIYNNFFNNTKNYDDRDNTKNIWNTPKKLGRNIVGGPYLGGNYWSDYIGIDTNGDGLGDNNLPYGPGDNLPLLDIIPPMVIDNTSGIPTTGDQFIFNTIAWDNFIVQNSFIEYWFDNRGHTTKAMTRISGNYKNGTYSLIINVSSNALTLHYFFSVVDRGGNWKSTNKTELIVIDNDAPLITDKTSSLPTTGDNFTFEVVATDNIMVSSVHVEFWFDNKANKNITLNLQNKIYNTSIIIPPNTKNLYYIISAVDSSNNWAALNFTTLDIIDNDNPVIIDQSAIPTTGDDFTFNFKIEDNINLSIIYLEYWFDDQKPKKITFPKELYYNTSVPEDVFNLNAIVTACDFSNNSEVLEISKRVIDNDPPVINDLTYYTPETGNLFLINCTIIENRKIGNITLQYWFNDNKHNFSLINPKKSKFNELIHVPEDACSMNYLITADDTSNNFARLEKTQQAIDIIPPIIHDRTEGVPTTGDNFAINASIVDNIGVESVSLDYWVNDNIHTNMHFTGNQSIVIPINSIKLHYIISALDVNMNTAYVERILNVSDNDKPIIEDLSLNIATTGDPFNFSAKVDDNIQVSEVKIEYWSDAYHFNKEMNLIDDIYRKNIKIFKNAKFLSYIISAVDSTGNIKILSNKIQVIDNDKPMINDLSFESGEIFKIIAMIEDNIKVFKGDVEYSFDGENIRKLPLRLNNSLYQGTIIIIKGAKKLYYTILAMDTSGNIERMEKEIELLKAEQDTPESELSSPSKTSKKIEFWVILLLIIIIVGISVFYIYFIRKQSEQKLSIKESVTIKLISSPTLDKAQEKTLETPTIPQLLGKATPVSEEKQPTVSTSSIPKLPGTTPTTPGTIPQQIPQVQDKPQLPPAQTQIETQESKDETQTPTQGSSTETSEDSTQSDEFDENPP